MPIMIHNKSYITVAERLTAAKDDLLSVDTQILYTSPVVIKATICTKKGTFTGISAANPSKSIEKESAYEVAETSAVGRALAFAGYETTEGIASAEEMQKIFVPETKEVNAIDDTLTSNCRVHGDPMVQKVSAKTGNPYWSHKMPNGELCFGR